MEEHRLNDIDIKMEAIETALHATDDDHETEHDCDDEDEDVVSILSNSTMNTNCLLELKSDPILEKYNDDDSSSTDSDDSLVNELAELEEKYNFVKTKTEEYWGKIFFKKLNLNFEFIRWKFSQKKIIVRFVETMKKPLNFLSEEIAAMAKSDPSCVSSVSIENARIKDEERQNSSTVKSSSSETKRKRKKSRSQLVQEIRISVSIEKYFTIHCWPQLNAKFVIYAALIRRNEA